MKTQHAGFISLFLPEARCRTDFILSNGESNMKSKYSIEQNVDEASARINGIVRIEDLSEYFHIGNPEDILNQWQILLKKEQ